MIDLRDFCEWIAHDYIPAVDRAHTPGLYARHPRETEGEIYGFCDVACILYSLGLLDDWAVTRDRWQAAFDHFTDAESGMIVEKSPTHCKLHNTAFALSAKNLLHLDISWPQFMDEYFSTDDQPERFLSELDWHSKVYSHSHQGAGLGSIVSLCGTPEAVEPWMQRYFSYCCELFDPANGMMGRDKPASGDTDQIGGTFHYAFLFEHYKLAMPYPQARIDSILQLQRPDGFWSEQNRWWLTLDAIFMLSRSASRSSHRLGDVRDAIYRAIDAVFQCVATDDARQKIISEYNMVTHALTAIVNMMAEAQSFLGTELLKTSQPLKLVLDKRPFI